MKLLLPLLALILFCFSFDAKAQCGSYVLNVFPTEPTCFQFSDGSIIITTTGGNGGDIFTITDTFGIQLNGVNSNVVNNITSGWYYFEVEDVMGCLLIDSIFLDEPSELAIDLTITNPVCFGAATGTAVVDTVYNYAGSYFNVNYFWNPNPASVGSWQDSSYAMVAGSYIITILDNNGCAKNFDFDIIDLSPSPLIFSALGSDPAYCRMFNYQSGNGVVYGSAAGGVPNYTYQWKNLTTGTISSYGTWGGLNVADYEMTVTDNLGCVLKDTVTLDSLNPIAIFDVVSSQLNLNLDGPQGAFVEFQNQSLYFANPNDPSADTTFFWNLNYNTAPWEISFDVNEIFDTTYDALGNYEVCLVALNKNGCSDTSCQTIGIFVAGLNDHFSETDFVISSTGNSVLVQLSNSEQNFRVEIYSVSGQLIRKESIAFGANNFEIPRGQYIFYIVSESNNELIKSEKVVVIGK